MRATAMRLWLPISLSVALHVLALGSLQNLLLHGKSGQLDAGGDEGLRVRLLDIRSSSSERPPQQYNAATPMSNDVLPGRAQDVAQLSTLRSPVAEIPQEKPLTLAAPSHPQKLADGAATLSSSQSADGVAVRPRTANGGKGNFDSSYIPSTAVQRPPIPLTQPDLSRLATIARPHAAIALRAYVEQSGSVHDVVVMSCDPEDQATADLLAKIYKDVVYMAAYDHGKQVSSKIDFTITLSDASLPSDRPERNIIRKSTP